MSQKVRIWYKDDLTMYDMLPCPHCLEPCYLDGFQNAEGILKPHSYNCTNEKCFAGQGKELLTHYYKEFQFVLDRFYKEYYKYPKKVIEFAKQFAKEKK